MFMKNDVWYYDMIQKKNNWLENITFINENKLQIVL